MADNVHNLNRGRAPVVVHNFQPKPRSPLSTTKPAPHALKLAHHTLVSKLMALQAEEITGCWAHPSEITDRADHLEKVLAVVNDYADVVLRDTADVVHMHRDVVVGGLRDAASDLCAHVRFRAELLAEERGGR
jgi:hypothetical protein